MSIFQSLNAQHSNNSSTRRLQYYKLRNFKNFQGPIQGGPKKLRQIFLAITLVNIRTDFNNVFTVTFSDELKKG